MRERGREREGERERRKERDGKRERETANEEVLFADTGGEAELVGRITEEKIVPIHPGFVAVAMKSHSSISVAVCRFKS